MKLSGVIFPTSWIFLGNHDDLGLFGDLAWIIWGYFSHFLEFFGESSSGAVSSVTRSVIVIIDMELELYI